jgi:serine/threonine protein kinase
MLKNKLTISEDRVWKIISQFFIALAVLNDKNMAHRDVKDGNIFIDEDDNIVLGVVSSFICGVYDCAGDYGFAKEASFDSHQLESLVVGTVFGFDTWY